MTLTSFNLSTSAFNANIFSSDQSLLRCFTGFVFGWIRSLCCIMVLSTSFNFLGDHAKMSSLFRRKLSNFVSAQGSRSVAITTFSLGLSGRRATCFVSPSGLAFGTHLGGVGALSELPSFVTSVVTFSTVSVSRECMNFWPGAVPFSIRRAITSSPKMEITPFELGNFMHR
uniref:Uncharacterized protein n=1 Tax=Arundo donax TaxID=35708 RepID=A0A0A9F9B3_ARUDO